MKNCEFLIKAMGWNENMALVGIATMIYGLLAAVVSTSYIELRAGYVIFALGIILVLADLMILIYSKR